MAKSQTQTRFVCRSCGHGTLKWMGRCPECGEWNTLIEEVVRRAPAAASNGPALRLGGGSLPQPLHAIDLRNVPRLASGIGEFDRVLGGGVVPGSLVLVGGDPGVGKSTLLLQAADRLSRQFGTVLYASGEESVQQIKLRADRLGVSAEQLLLLAENDIEVIEEHVRGTAPRLLIVDSIQTMQVSGIESAPGTVSQVRESAARLMRLAKDTGLPVFLVGHVTKEGALAGPRVLEHMVDTVLYFEGDRHQALKVLRAVKNRFGSTDELGIFEMHETGLLEVENPSQAFLSERPAHVPGSVVVPAVEGSRPILVEVQALVAPAYYGTPRRMASGCDYNRLCLGVAVLEKRLGLALGSRDVYVSIAGGVRVTEPAADLGMAVAMASSFHDVPADPHSVFIGEVGLAGEVRAVQQMERRINEATRLGFKRAFVARGGRRPAQSTAGLRVTPVETVRQAVDAALEQRGE